MPKRWGWFITRNLIEFFDASVKAPPGQPAQYVAVFSTKRAAEKFITARRLATHKAVKMVQDLYPDENPEAIIYSAIYRVKSPHPESPPATIEDLAITQIVMDARDPEYRGELYRSYRTSKRAFVFNIFRVPLVLDK